MLYSIQDKLKIDLPIRHADKVDAYNEEWDRENGQGWEVKNFIELTKDRKTLYDVGGNVGFFSYVFCLNNNDDKMKMSYCFEPSPEGLTNAVEIINHNDWFDRIKLFPMFIGDKNGVVSILTEESGTFVVRFEKEDPNFQIVKKKEIGGRIATLDDFTWIAEMGDEDKEYGLDMVFEDKRERKNKDYPGFKRDFDLDTLKIDVEGYEQRVLKGAKETITKYRPLIFLEIHSHLLNLYNNNVLEIYETIEQYGYNMYDVHMEEIKNKQQYESLFGAKNEIRVVCKGD
tara:strand:- start:1034 stop:1891 length:858 start_codon:yes stop_codon:yes gene_type:complete